MPEAEPAANKYCGRCHGFCPSGVGDDGLCGDCHRHDSPEEEAKREFARALASRSPFWRRVVRMDRQERD